MHILELFDEVYLSVPDNDCAEKSVSLDRARDENYRDQR